MSTSITIDPTSKRLPILYDRSRSTTDWQCQRRRYWNYEYGGKGVVPNWEDQALFLGTTLHDGLAGIARSIDIDKICSAAYANVLDVITDGGGEEQYAYEQATLIEGLLRGFHKHVWPQLIATYPKIITIEQEMTYHHDGMIFMSKPDIILGNAEGDVVYVEYKSTSSKKDSWIKSWNKAVQLHSTCMAVRETLGVMPTAVIVQGLYKGYESYGKQTSPFCYAYMRSGNPPFTTTQISYEYKAGFKKSPVWDLEGGIKGWVEDMPPNILADQFPRTPPIYVKEEMINKFFAQRHMRENEIRLALDIMKGDPASKEEVMNVSFQQRFDQCEPAYGKVCPYVDLCFRNGDDPIAAGYEWRQPHHAPETEMMMTKEAIEEYVKETAAALLNEPTAISKMLEEDGYGHGV